MKTSLVRDPSDHAHLGGQRDAIMRSGGMLFVEGRVAGSWTGALGSSEVAIDIRSIVPIGAATRRAIEAEAAEFGQFCERTPVLELVHQPA